MTGKVNTLLPEVLRKHEEDLVAEWLSELTKASGRQKALMREEELAAQCREFLNLLQNAVQHAPLDNLSHSSWEATRELLSSISRSRTEQGFSPVEIATFVFSFKKPLFDRLRRETDMDATRLAEEIWNATRLLDSLGLFTMQIHQETREAIIFRQQQDLLELSTPVVKLWDGILALPLIGTLDSARTQVVMESLLNRIVETGSSVAIIDITGVPTVDTLVAQHLIKAVTAARLMGADCIISGIRPQIAQTIVHLGVALGDVVTKGNLADAFTLALRQLGLSVVRKMPHEERTA
jgi:rsbT co-antagonist protein RsbR